MSDQPSSKAAVNVIPTLTQPKAQQYAPMAVSVLPESVTAATINQENRRLWAKAGGSQS